MTEPKISASIQESSVPDISVKALRARKAAMVTCSSPSLGTYRLKYKRDEDIEKAAAMVGRYRHMLSHVKRLQNSSKTALRRRHQPDAGVDWLSPAMVANKSSTAVDTFKNVAMGTTEPH